jgi:hypothetical protein
LLKNKWKKIDYFGEMWTSWSWISIPPFPHIMLCISVVGCVVHGWRCDDSLKIHYIRTDRETIYLYHT